MNMPLAMSVVWEVIRNEIKSKKLALLLEKFDEVLGLDLKNYHKYMKKELNIPEEIMKLIEERKIAKQEKNYKLADELRDKIKEKGYIIKDTSNGVDIEKIN